MPVPRALSAPSAALVLTLALGPAATGLALPQDAAAEAGRAPVAELAAPFLGAWMAADDSGDAWLFEETRAGWGAAPQPSFTRTTWRADGVTLEAWAQRRDLGLEREGDSLWVTRDGERRRFERAEAMPGSLVVQTPDIAAPEPLEPDALDALRAELSERRDKEQAVRARISDPDEDQSVVMSEMHRIDVDNTAWLKERMADTGWFDAARFGRKATGDAFLIVQHSGDLGLMTAALPLIKAEIRSGAIRGDQFALLYDRLALNLGRKQSFGSQLSGNDDGLFVCPLDDPEGVDARRKAVGMGPLVDYLELFRDQNGGALPQGLDGTPFGE